MAKEQRMLSLTELEQLARQPSSENWHNLLRGLTDHFLARADVYAEQYGEAFSDIICRLLDEVNIEAREELSARVAPLELFPDQIVKRLAHDEYTVAAPVLESSPILSDSDLIDIANIVMQDHWLAISRRKALGPRLTDALMKFDSQEVIREMAGNPGARFSASTYRKVAERAKKDEVLQEKLVEREDLSPAIAIQLNPFLSDELKNKLNSAQPTESKGLLESLSEFTGDTQKKGKKQDTNSDPDSANVQVSIKRVKEGKADVSRVVTSLADEGRFSGVCIFLGGVALLPEKTINGALLNVDSMPITIICRGLGLTVDAFEAITHMRCERLSLPHEEIALQVQRFRDFKASEAEKALAVLQLRKAKELKTSAA